MSRLLVSTPYTWVQKVLSDFNVFLQDHANCERKAVATAMSFVVRYADKHQIVEAMIDLAKEEMEHFQQVYRLMAERGILLSNDEKDPYVGALLKHVQHGREQHLLDRLLVSGVIEARGCERFQLVAEALVEPQLKNFYLDLARSEARHAGLFIRLARLYFADNKVDERLHEWFVIEKEIISQLPHRIALH